MRILVGPRRGEARSHACGSRLAISEIEPAVKRIVDDVRNGGDKSLRRYAERWDGLQKDSRFQSEEERNSGSVEMQRRSAFAICIARSREEHPEVLRVAKTERVETQFQRRLGRTSRFARWSRSDVTFRADDIR